ncbi:FAD-dependent oxidoreductase [Calothrix sp. NIES-2098]|uniref:FAD-dependent oxidoreductase n=1 Tax=Calothrix sp. NIES-2098 TaxID=1954171 RepID=UPI000B62274B|nr:monooxygenase FAD-binding protein [Calothrix sp. NIES-2098]
MNKKIAIIGAGLGGLAVAIALHKKGINAQIYEKATVLRPIGAGLSILPNGLHSLEAIAPGITDLLKQAGSETRMLTLKKSCGEIIAQKAVNLMDKYGQPMLQIRWSRLQEILASALPTENIHFGYQCISFEQNDNSVKVYFDGNKTVEAELLIGADGLNSAVRQTMIGDGEPHQSKKGAGLKRYSPAPGPLPEHSDFQLELLDLLHESRKKSKFIVNKSSNQIASQAKTFSTIPILFFEDAKNF